MTVKLELNECTCICLEITLLYLIILFICKIIKNVPPTTLWFCIYCTVTGRSNLSKQLEQYVFSARVHIYINSTDSHLLAKTDVCSFLKKKKCLWKTNVVFQASFNPGKKAHQLMPEGCLFLPYVCQQNDLVSLELSDSLMCFCCFLGVVLPFLWTLTQQEQTPSYI